MPNSVRKRPEPAGPPALFICGVLIPLPGARDAVKAGTLPLLPFLGSAWPPGDCDDKPLGKHGIYKWKSLALL